MKALKNIDKNVLNNLSFRSTSTTLNHQRLTNDSFRFIYSNKKWFKL